MKYLLDTNVCVDYLNGRYSSVTTAIHAADPDELCVSSIAVAELRYGAEKSSQRQRNHTRLDLFLAEIRCVDFDAAAAAFYGRVRAALEKRAKVIGPYDMQIGAHALALGLILVTDNTNEFRRVPGLKVENWRR